MDGMQSYAHHNTQFSLTLIFVTVQLILSTPLLLLLKFKKLQKKPTNMTLHHSLTQRTNTLQSCTLHNSLRPKQLLLTSIIIIIFLFVFHCSL